MGGMNSGVDDIGINPGARMAVDVSIIQRERSLSNTIKTEGGVRLRRDNRRFTIFFDKFDPWILTKDAGRRLRYLERKSFDGVLINMLEIPSISLSQIVSHGGNICPRSVIPEHDNISTGDRFLDFT